MELRLVDFSAKPSDYFFDAARTAKKPQENLKKTEKREYLSQNINLINKEYDNIFEGDEELRHIKPFLRNQQDFLVFQNENFVRSPQQTPQKHVDFSEKPQIPQRFSAEPRENVQKTRENTEKFREVSQTSVLRSSRKIFEKEDSADSLEKKDVNLLKDSLNDLDFKRVHAVKPSNFATNSGKFDHLFERKI